MAKQKQEEPKAKSALESKTIIFNMVLMLLGLLLAVFQALQAHITAQWLGITVVVIGAIGTYLRTITVDGIQWK
jgi:hypothetical membrane protein